MGPVIAAALKYGPALLSQLGLNLGRVGGVMSPEIPSKFRQALDEEMNRGPQDPIGPGMLKGTTGGDEPPVFRGDLTVTAPAPTTDPNSPGFNQGEGSESEDVTGEGLSGGGGAGGPGGGGLPPWMEKLGAGLRVGEALQPKFPRAPSLPTAGRFEPQNSVLQFLAMMRSLRGR